MILRAIANTSRAPCYTTVLLSVEPFALKRAIQGQRKSIVGACIPLKNAEDITPFTYTNRILLRKLFINMKILEWQHDGFRSNTSVMGACVRPLDFRALGINLCASLCLRFRSWCLGALVGRRTLRTKGPGDPSLQLARGLARGAFKTDLQFSRGTMDSGDPRGSCDRWRQQSTVHSSRC